MADGWIKFYRATLENPIVCKDADHLAVWVYLLLHVTHAEYDTSFVGGRFTLKPGQQLFGRKVISDDLKINQSKVQRILKTFENEHQIEQQTTNKNRLISIVNWDKYQGAEQQNEQQLNNNRTTTEQQLNTNKNNKNTKKTKNIYIGEDGPVDNSIEEIYDAYIPNKKRLPETTKRRIKTLVSKHGPEKVKRAVDRYKEATRDRELKYIKNSDGFFQDDYIKIYLEDDYKAPARTKGSSVTTFNDYEQREYDYDALEKSLLGWE
ncbi:hypothetical protein [Proteiniclasticum sp. QWL-01]|uniref:hypothetical protein n=1 Tax=Proteiniclasticum sp. QWL-01 TaxID=3036945 RepID=UPI002410A56E|nr:hypothetical protein [Proteiniclasticum sp. QWL-01]WFF72697.1 hypothetical protein P6M73_15715 [Proteiniclasticum sp. QWL-01]